MPGEEVLDELRKRRPEVPVIALSGKDGVDDRVAVLRAGADDYDEVVGFTAVDLPEGEPHGEIYMIAVDPSHQRKSIGRELTERAVSQMRAGGRRLAVVRTGGDSGHAPARATYESAGFVSLPGEQYFLVLDRMT